MCSARTAALALHLSQRSRAVSVFSGAARVSINGRSLITPVVVGALTCAQIVPSFGPDCSLSIVSRSAAAAPVVIRTHRASASKDGVVPVSVPVALAVLVAPVRDFRVVARRVARKSAVTEAVVVVLSGNPHLLDEVWGCLVSAAHEVSQHPSAPGRSRRLSAGSFTCDVAT
jgi:hypothetical protein